MKVWYKNFRTIFFFVRFLRVLFLRTDYRRCVLNRNSVRGVSTFTYWLEPKLCKLQNNFKHLRDLIITTALIQRSFFDSLHLVVSDNQANVNLSAYIGKLTTMFYLKRLHIYLIALYCIFTTYLSSIQVCKWRYYNRQQRQRENWKF